jgi:hypothetical protein
VPVGHTTARTSDHTSMGLPYILASIGVLPPWSPTYSMARSTLTMQCNSSGFSSPGRGAAFGITSYDWSNAKKQWAAQRPMDCEERLLEQARMTKASGGAHVWVYRNIVKALPWFSSVRAKLLNPAYAGWFLRFDAAKPRSTYNVPACAAENQSKCSPFYHDQEQTPEVPTQSKPHPDGACGPAGCDCGEGLPCGEYLFDHRNASLRAWLVAQVGSPTALGDHAIDGLFIDDFWCSNLLCEEDPGVAGCPCGDPVQGPTEVDRNAQADMGLGDEDIRELTLEWNKTMAEVQAAIVRQGGYTWSLMLGQENANASPRRVSQGSCTAQLRNACTPRSDWQEHAILFGLTVNGTALPQLQQDIAFFLLARGPFAWAGWGVWGMTWPFNAEPAHGQLPALPHGVPRPAELDAEYGEPLGLCREEAEGVFVRNWSVAGQVRLDCHSFEASLGRVDEGDSVSARGDRHPRGDGVGALPLPRISVASGTATQPGTFLAGGSHFSPRGANYIRLNGSQGGAAGMPPSPVYHSTFSPKLWNASEAAEALAWMASGGYNIVRVFLDHGGGGRDDGIAGSSGPTDEGGLSAPYLDNLAEFLRLAAAAHVYTILTLERLPASAPFRCGRSSGGGGEVAAAYPNTLVLDASCVASKARYVVGVLRGMKSRLGVPLLSTIAAISIANEWAWDVSTAPWTASTGFVRDANGTMHDLRRNESRQLAADASLQLWAEAALEAARSIDPSALVTLGMFTFQAVKKDSRSSFGLWPSATKPHTPPRERPGGKVVPGAVPSAAFSLHPSSSINPLRSGPLGSLSGDPSGGRDDPRVPPRPAVLGGVLPMLDVHVYQVPMPASTREWSLATDLASSDWAALADQPAAILMGEFGAWRENPDLFGNASAAAQAMTAQQRGSCAFGFAGWLLWTLDTWEQPRLWNMRSAQPLFDQLSPVGRPDPCA